MRKSTNNCEERENQQDATIGCLLSTSVSTCFGHYYAHLQENKDRVTAFGVLFWFCWMWLVAVVGRCAAPHTLHGLSDEFLFLGRSRETTKPRSANPQKATNESI